MRQRSITVVFITLFMLTGFFGFTLSGAVAADYRWLMGQNDPLAGAGFCAPDDPNNCHDAAVAANGDVLEMHGVGTLSVADGDGKRSINGGGTFIHRDEFVVVVILTIPPGEPDKITANLQAPLVFNTVNRCAKQIILVDQYTTRYPITGSNADADVPAKPTATLLPAVAS